MKEILFIHSAGPQGDQQGSDYLVKFLIEQLGQDYQVRHPMMPDPENPHYEEWKEKLQSELMLLQGNVVIGHSLGGSVLLKYLSECTNVNATPTVFLIAPPYWGAPEWEVDEYQLNDDSLSTTFSKLFIYHSQDDEVVPVQHVGMYKAQFPNAVVCTLQNRGHLFSKGLPELVRDIKKLATHD